jgi:RHS repeat-associated protein
VVRLPLGFAGGLFDADTGLTRFVWRDYDADTSRFTALDPMGEKGGDKDWYGYCVNDPVNRVDMWGLWTVNAGVSGSASGFGVGGTASGSVGRDGEGNWALQGTVGAGPSAGYGASIAGFGQATNATHMDDLAGKGSQVGWNAAEIPVGEFKFGPGLGVDKVTGNDYSGVEVAGNFGAGALFETHAYETYTWSKDLPVPDFRRDNPSNDFDLYNRD